MESNTRKDGIYDVAYNVVLTLNWCYAININSFRYWNATLTLFENISNKIYETLK